MVIGIVEVIVIVFLLAFALVVAATALWGRRLDGYLGNHNQGELKTCPFCAEQIKKAAIICRYCQRDVASVETENKAPRGLFSD